jgi:hypothetical protein
LDLDNLELEDGSFEQWLADKRAELEAGVQAERSEDASD